MSKLLLKLHAWFYRRFGIYTKYARRKEQEYLRETLTGNESKMEKDLVIGCWQALNGFYRTWKQVEKVTKKRLEMRKKKKNA
jgi:uncharacterized membrane protein